MANAPMQSSLRSTGTTVTPTFTLLMRITLGSIFFFVLRHSINGKYAREADACLCITSVRLSPVIVSAFLFMANISARSFIPMIPSSNISISMSNWLSSLLDLANIMSKL